MSGRKVAGPDQIRERVQEIATAEGTTDEELATKGSSGISRVAGSSGSNATGEVRRGNMTDNEVEAVVERSVQDSRRRS